MNLSLHDLHVLLVEPSHMQAQLIERMLAQLGVTRVARRDTGGAALAYMREVRPSVVISSLYLPDLPGTELVQQMRADAELESLPFVLISSETRPQMLEPVRQSGACSILPKPFSASQLALALQNTLELLNPEAVFAVEEVEHLRVLVVEDSLASRRHIRRLLEDMGVRHIIEAEHGRAAVQRLADTMVDLVLTDYNMPEMDGRALVEYIRTQSWQASVPILMLTSEHDEERLAAVEKAGVSAICDKPFEARSIRQIIAQALFA
ncbi:MAG: response regulator [Azovibrio sp.]|nr:response regulator [Azovibrio sp.]